MTDLKKILRKEYKVLRNSISDREEKEAVITEKLLCSEIFEKADCVFLYAATNGEVSTSEIAEIAELSGKKTAYPFCKDKNGEMEFYFSKAENLKKGMYGIPEPDTDLCQKAKSTENSLCIVPGLAFGRKGERLGYGKGYYDRYLEHFSGVTAALFFEECLCENIPMEKTDKKIDYLFTDKKIYKTE